MKASALVLMALAGVSAVATATAQYSTNPDRQTGTVAVSYTTPSLQTPALSLKQANQVATRSCERLGYSFTERGVQVSQQCTSGSSSNCGQWQVTNTYQCAGNTQHGDTYQPVVTSVNPAGPARQVPGN